MLFNLSSSLLTVVTSVVFTRIPVNGSESRFTDFLISLSTYMFLGRHLLKMNHKRNKYLMINNASVEEQMYPKVII